MSRLFVPPDVARELMEERQQREAAALQAISADHAYHWKREFDADLQNIDPYLQLVWCPEPAPVDALATGATPGRWHIARHNPGAPMSLIPLQTSDGEYAEPGSWVFDMLANSDLWDDRVERDRARKQQQLARERERREARERQERREELAERVAANTQVRISFDQGHRWTQNAAGRRGRR